jgi:hypothetical protein
MKTTQIDELRQTIMSAAPGDPVWATPEYQAYEERLRLAADDDHYGRAGLFALHGDVLHRHCCSEVGLLEPLLQVEQTLAAFDRMLAAGHEDRFQDCQECQGFTLFLPWWQDREREREYQVRVEVEHREEQARQRERHELALTVECPKCGSPAGRNCRTSTGKCTSNDHAARVQAAQDQHQGGE